jgi:hypothetical protein
MATVLLLVFLAQNGAAAVPGILPDSESRSPASPENGSMRLAAADSPKSKGKKKTQADPVEKEEFRKRGEELGNFIYEVFDPNAKDPLADLELPGEGKPRSRRFWWIAGGAVGLVGVGVAGYYLIAPGPDIIKIRYLDFCDSGPCGPGNQP